MASAFMHEDARTAESNLCPALPLLLDQIAVLLLFLHLQPDEYIAHRLHLAVAQFVLGDNVSRQHVKALAWARHRRQQQLPSVVPRGCLEQLLQLTCLLVVWRRLNAPLTLTQIWRNADLVRYTAHKQPQPCTVLVALTSAIRMLKRA